VKRFLPLALIALASFLSACGGSGSSGIVVPPQTGTFGPSSLKGQYAFSMSGSDFGGAFIARVGSFNADGNGNITGGLEDFLDLGTGTTSEVSFTGGSYTMQGNGRGTVTLLASGGGELLLSLTLTSTSGGLLIQTDLTGTSSGNMNLQAPADFAATAISGKYVFDFSGISVGTTGAAPISIIGQIIADGNGNITGGTVDENDGLAPAPSGPITLTPGTYLLDSTGAGTNFGRGTMSFDGRSFVYYIVDHTHIKVMEEDTLAGSLGDAVAQNANIPTQNSAFTGSFAYLVGGGIVTGNGGPIASVARFTSDANGGIGNLSYDENAVGSTHHISQGTNLSATTYSIDTTNAGTGRGTFTFTDTSGGTFTYVFYMISATKGVIQDTSSGIIGDGSLQAQTASPFTLTSVAGSYAFNWSGQQLGSSTFIPFEEDFVGQYALTTPASNNIAGAMDYVELGSTNKQLFSDVGIGGTLTISGDGTANNAYRVTTGNSPSTTFNFQAYIVNPSTVFLLSTDNSRTTAGIATQQVAP